MLTSISTVAEEHLKKLGRFQKEQKPGITCRPCLLRSSRNIFSTLMGTTCGATDPFWTNGVDGFLQHAEQEGGILRNLFQVVSSLLTKEDSKKTLSFNEFIRTTGGKLD